MKIEELDEAQGLTADMVRDWLRAQGWVREPQLGFQLARPPCVLGFRWVRGDESILDESLLSRGLRFIVDLERRSPQSLLREMNPRMRSWPSEGAVVAHAANGGLWLGRKPNHGGLLVMEFEADHTEDDPVMARDDFGDTYWECDCENWSFWPCDANGNKVRWPENDKGEMI